MKNFLILPLALALLVCSGCVTRYRVTLSNGSYFTTHGKPHLNKDRNVYTYTDATGNRGELPAFSIRQIEPESMHKTDNPSFLPSSK
jgi:Bacterial protein of unknown function (DUF903)